MDSINLSSKATWVERPYPIIGVLLCVMSEATIKEDESLGEYVSIVTPLSESIFLGPIAQGCAKEMRTNNVYSKEKKKPCVYKQVYKYNYLQIM